MVVVRILFQTKWGKAQEVVEMLKEGIEAMADVMPERPIRILTDLSGPSHTVVQEIEAESIGEWEQERLKVFAHPEFQKRMGSMGDLILTGSIEYYTIEN